MLQQIVIFEVALFPILSLEMWWLTRKQLIKFLFWFWHWETIPVYIPTHQVISFTSISHHLPQFSWVRKSFILLQLKMVSHIACSEKFIICFYWNHEHTCKECSQKQITHVLYRKLLWMWLFELQLDYVESIYTPELLGVFSCFLLMLNSSVSANKWSYRYWILTMSLDR